ncbi:hypothetical protein [Hymenobacter psychrotolerans]|uniref:hypothetical protein n=1 Tax=Hymenobacter psychrotolerans TaxID=344998 RepID=UPI0009320DBA|nr:hypothetical protein [Hymenobacter psychrotolerans]
MRVAFVVPARIEPGGDVLALGDTLWLDLDASDSVLFEPVYDAGRQRHRARVGMVAREWGGLVVR